MPTASRYAQLCAAGAAAILAAAFVSLELQSRQLMKTCQQTDSVASCQLKLYGR